VTDPEADQSGKPLSALQRAIVDAAVVGAGLRLGADAGAVVSTFAIPFAEEIVRRARDEFRTDAEQRVAQMLGLAAEELGCNDPDQLGDMISKSERTRLLAITAMDGAIKTAWPPRVVAIGRVLAAGLIATDDTMIDVEQMALGAMADMDAMHVSALELLVCWMPPSHTGSREKRKYEGPPAHPAEVPPNLDPGARMWNTGQICTVRPQLCPVLTSLLGTLERHGLVVENDNTIKALEIFLPEGSSKEVAEPTFPSEGDQPRPPAKSLGFSRFDLMRIFGVPTWSPTELGERVLGYYRLAATEQGGDG
jgi:hypothetical protein